MIEGQKVLAVIPARGGSKGVQRKNIRQVAGKPLIAWTIFEAKKSRYLDRVIVSSEDQEVIAVAQQWGGEAPFIRPRELALDDTPGIAPVLHALDALPEKYDYVVLLQPTSPLRLATDIDGCLEKCLNHKALACISVSEAILNPFWMYVLDGDQRLIPLIDQETIALRRQELPGVYALNGAIYVAQTKWLQQSRSFLTPDTLAYVMPRERSLDIDTEVDLRLCELLLSEA